MKIDVRVKLIVTLCVSTLAIIFSRLSYSITILGVAVIISYILGGNIISTIRKLSRILGVFLIMIIAQSLFINEGRALIEIANISLVTDVGLMRAINFILRISTILVGATIVATSNSREIIQGMIQLGMPYELAFMVSVAIRFLPTLSQELRDSMNAIALRGISIKGLGFKSKIELYRYIFTPIVIRSITKAKRLSLAMECRGFRAYEKRTSIVNLRMSSMDYTLASISVVSSTMILITYIWG